MPKLPTVSCRMEYGSSIPALAARIVRSDESVGVAVQRLIDIMRYPQFHCMNRDAHGGSEARSLFALSGEGITNGRFECDSFEIIGRFYTMADIVWRVRFMYLYHTNKPTCDEEALDRLFCALGKNAEGAAALKEPRVRGGWVHNRWPEVAWLIALGITAVPDMKRALAVLESDPDSFWYACETLLAEEVSSLGEAFDLLGLAAA